MSVPLPLAVRLRTPRTDRHIRRDIHDLTFSSGAPSGFLSCNVSLNRPLTLQPDEIDYYASLYVYDTRNGQTIWEGQLEDPGRSVGRMGEVWNLTAVGPAARAQDQTLPLIYVDQGITAYVRTDNVLPSGTVGTGTDPGDAAGLRPALVFSVAQGTGVVTNSRVVTEYQTIWLSEQKIGRVDYAWDSGTTDAQWVVEAIMRTDGSQASGQTARTQTLSAGGGVSAAKVIGTDWTAGRNTVDLRMRYTAGGGTVGDTNHWLSIFSVVVQATRFDRTGAELLTGASYTTNTILASDVIADLLGRILTTYDGANAVITTTSFAIDQLAYPDGVTAARVMDDLMQIEPGYYWAVWESNSAHKYRFEWLPWPTSVRYESVVDDGIDSPGSADGLYNGVRVRYRGVNGVINSQRLTQTVDTLTGAGLTRDAFIDLGDNLGSSAMATQVGTQFLVDHASAPNAGTLSIGRPTIDLIDGRWKMPWELRPGALIRVRGILPRTDALNATVRDGVTIFRIRAVEFQARTGTAKLTLDSFPPSASEMLARLARAQPTTVGTVRRR